MRPCKGTGERGAVYQQYAVMQKSAGTTSGVQVTWMVQEYRLNFLSNEKCAACKMYTAPTFSKRRFVFDSECCGYSSENSFHNHICKGADANMIVQISRRQEITKGVQT